MSTVFLATLYGPNKKIKRDLDLDQYTELKATGEWFDSPNEALDASIAKKEAELAAAKAAQDEADKKAAKEAAAKATEEAKAKAEVDATAAAPNQANKGK